MSRRKTDADFFRHVSMRARARYGVELPEHVWRSWNEHIAEAPVVRQWRGTSVRVFVFHGRKFFALCSARRVTTVVPPENYATVPR